MKNFFEKLLDFIYDYIDYIIMLVIILLVVGIIGWRLDLIFTDNGTGIPPIEEENEEFEDEKEKELEEEDERVELEEDATEDDEDEESEDQAGLEVEIEIPSGTLPSGIASILLENQLIDDNSEFLAEVEEGGYETGLKAGVYVIPVGSSIDEILQILTN